MIVRILGEGQWNIADHLTELNRLDDAVEKAVENGDQDTFSATLRALLQAVRDTGSPLADDALEESDLILPPDDATLEEVRALLNDDGLIPG